MVDNSRREDHSVTDTHLSHPANHAFTAPASNSGKLHHSVKDNKDLFVLSYHSSSRKGEERKKEQALFRWYQCNPLSPSPFECHVYINDLLPCHLGLLYLPTNQRTVDCIARIYLFCLFHVLTTRHLLRLGEFFFYTVT
jgi:hypothetical protein